MENYISKASNCQDVIADKDEMVIFMNNFKKELNQIIKEMENENEERVK